MYFKNLTKKQKKELKDKRNLRKNPRGKQFNSKED